MKMFGNFIKSATLLASSTLVTAALLAAAKSGQAEVKAVTGSVMLDTVAVKIGDLARQGQTIKTGLNSRTALDLAQNGALIHVLADSVLQIDDLNYDDAGAEPVAHTTLLLKKGDIDGEVKKKSAQSTFLVKTPTTTAAIRGTKFSISSTGTIYVWDGSVDVTFGGRSYNVSAGQMLDTSSFGTGTGTVVDIPPGIKAPDFSQFGGGGAGGGGFFFGGDGSTGPKVFISPN